MNLDSVSSNPLSQYQTVEQFDKALDICKPKFSYLGDISYLIGSEEVSYYKLEDKVMGFSHSDLKSQAWSKLVDMKKKADKLAKQFLKDQVSLIIATTKKVVTDLVNEVYSKEFFYKSKHVVTSSVKRKQKY